MFDLNLPRYDFNIRSKEGKQQIFDALRKRFVALTPEEWVRQHFSRFLLEEKGFPGGRMIQEAVVVVNGQRKRCDTVVYDSSTRPLVLIEYKAPDVPITQHVFDQIASYNFALNVNYLIVSNGISHYCCKMNYDTHSMLYLKDIPSYSEL
jgi:hypothetical protein